MTSSNGIGESLHQIEQLVERHLVRQARSELNVLLTRKIPREHVAQAAHLSRWALMPEKALKLLHKIVRPTRHSLRAASASPREQAVYAAALHDIGAYRESLSLLQQIDSTRVPEALLYRAQVCTGQWDWASPIPFLEKLLKHPTASARDKIYGELLLGSSLMYGLDDYVQAEKTLKSLLERANEPSFRYFHKNAVFLLGQNEYLRGNLKEAQALIDKFKTMAEADGAEGSTIIAQQWTAVIGLASGKDKAGFLKMLHEARAAFVAAKRWERVRMCDFHEYRILGEQSLLARLYFGTPFPAFRKRIASLLPEDAELPKGYEWELAPNDGKKSGLMVNLSDTGLKEGQLLQRLLQVLASDFYRPLQIAEIHQFLFLNEYFNPASSPDRVHQAIRRLRLWFKKSKLPLDVQEDNGLYRLVAYAPCSLSVGQATGSQVLDKSPDDLRLGAMLEKLKAKFAGAAFSANEAAEVWDISYRSAVRYLAQAREKQLVCRQDKGPLTSYRLP